MENNNTSLAPLRPLFPILEKQEKQLAIVEKLLAESVQSKILNIALNHPEFFKRMISRYYPLTIELIEKYKDILYWDFWGISKNPALPWSPELIERYTDKWSWDYSDFSSNESVYQKAFQPYLTDSFIDEVMNKIKNV